LFWWRLFFELVFIGIPNAIIWFPTAFFTEYSLFGFHLKNPKKVKPLVGLQTASRI